jgi:hypothetical protein
MQRLCRNVNITVTHEPGNKMEQYLPWIGLSQVQSLAMRKNLTSTLK